MLPVILAAVECPTPTIVDAALRSLPVILPVLDFSTIKNELFPVVAMVFSKTNSLAIKVRGLQAFVILCGGTNESSVDDGGLSGLVSESKKSSSSSALDKYTMQEKIVPLVKVIKTKEPAVMMAARDVLNVVGQAADAEFVAMDILPILWTMSLGPLLNLKQFQTFMDLIKSLSRRVEDEQTRKLQELTGTSNGSTVVAANDDFLAFGGVTGTAFDPSNGGGGGEDDFEALVKGRAGGSSSNGNAPSWDDAPVASSISATTTGTTARSSSSTPQTPSFSWSTQSPVSQTSTSGFGGNLQAQQPSFRTVTPDLARFESMKPASTQFSQPLQPTSASSFQQQQQQLPRNNSSSSVNWSTASSSNRFTPPPMAPNYSSNLSMTSTTSNSGYGAGLGSSMSNMSLGNQRPPAMTASSSSSFSLPPPPSGSGAFANTGSSGFGIAPPPAAPSQSTTWSTTGSMPSKPMGFGGMSNTMGSGSIMGQGMGAPPPPPQQQQQQQKSGLDKYESLI